MQRKQEPKYRAVADHYPENDGLAVLIVDGYLINRQSGEPIPADEPVFIFRARDKHAASALIFYRDQCEDPIHKAAIQARWEDFMRFWREHPDCMKEPDTEPQS